MRKERRITIKVIEDKTKSGKNILVEFFAKKYSEKYINKVNN